jgi:hypothetical protein
MREAQQLAGHHNMPHAPSANCLNACQQKVMSFVEHAHLRKLQHQTHVISRPANFLTSVSCFFCGALSAVAAAAAAAALVLPAAVLSCASASVTRQIHAR